MNKKFPEQLQMSSRFFLYFVTMFDPWKPDQFHLSLIDERLEGNFAMDGQHNGCMTENIFSVQLCV